MPVEIKPANIIKARLGIQPNGRIQKFFTNTCAKHMDKYVPFRTGTLAETVVINGNPTSNVKDKTINYEQPYARYVYYGISKNGKPLVYNKSMHAYAGKYWDKRMWSAEKDKILNEVQNELNRGGK